MVYKSIEKKPDFIEVMSGRKSLENWIIFSNIVYIWTTKPLFYVTFTTFYRFFSNRNFLYLG